MLLPLKYSERLGLIEPEQLYEAARRVDLGDVLDAYPGPGGPFGQNVVLLTTRGTFVLRGNPHGHVQLTKERRVAHVIHERSSLAAPWPYLVCEDTDVFGWTFAVLPHLGGEPGGDLWTVATEAGKRALARVTGEALSRLHDASFEFFGPYDAQMDDFIEMDDFADWFLYRLGHWRDACRAVQGLSTEAELWIDALIERCAPTLDEPFVPVLVHHDFTFDNLSFDDDGVAAGVFDLAAAHVGDGEEDLVRMLRAVESDEQRAAFVDEYVARRPLRPGASDRLQLYALADWLVVWEQARRLGTIHGDASFVDATRPVVETAASLGTSRR